MSFFSWKKDREQATQPTRIYMQRPATRDMSSPFVANETMLKGLWHGDYAGLQFASPLARTPIIVPVQMMGLPTPYSSDQKTQEALDEITKLMANRMPKMHRAYMLFGTTWRWPRFDSSSMSLVWEEIPDSTVADILADIVSGKPSAILCDEMIKISIGENRIALVQRKRRFDANKVMVKWYGEKPSNIQDYTARNISGLPVPFAHDADENEFRGYSVFAPIIRDLKDYHDIDYRISDTLSKFKVKQIQNTDKGKEWLEANGLSPADLCGFDIAGNEFVINRNDEKTIYEYLPEGATAAGEKTLSRKYWKFIEGSNVPEIFWGISLSGNHADAEQQVQKGVNYVADLRRELTPPYQALYEASLRVMSVAKMENYQPFEIKWNRLESVSADVKSQILQRYADAISKLMTSAGLTKKQSYNLWEMNFPESEPGTYEEFEKGLSEMAMHQQYLRLDYGMGLEDFNGGVQK